jgi:hypothetical protein
MEIPELQQEPPITLVAVVVEQVQLVRVLLR